MKNKFSIALILLSVFGCDCGDGTLYETCPVPEPCYVPRGLENTEKNMLTGESLVDFENQVCNFGTTRCDEKTFEITCLNIKYSEREICDGVDNDCDGTIDEELFIDNWKSSNPCKSTELGVCKLSDAICENGEWICIPPDGLYSPEERCDGLDNNCNGLTDEDILPEYIYSGPPETAAVGACRVGVKSCINGKEKVTGMVLPIQEICSNQIDDDCDGLTDEKSQQNNYDIALIIDVSGSMAPFIYSLSSAICSWAANPLFVDSRFAVVTVGDSATGNISGTRKVLDFTDAFAACIVINNQLINLMSSYSNEYQLDATLLAGVAGDQLELSWDDTGDREARIIIFSDEILQHSGQYPDVATAINENVAACQQNRYTVSAFIMANQQEQSEQEWRDLVDGCGGDLLYLNNNGQIMKQRLDSWFGEQC